MKKKAWVSLVAVVLVLCCAVGGTLAWLTAKTEEDVVNTFTPSGIDITLKETTGDNYKMIPGYTITKDPKATVVTGSEECYLFVKVEKSANFDSFMTWDIADGWQLVSGEDNVYARKVLTADLGSAYSVLKDDQVTVKGDVTKEMMNGLTAADYPTLTITAYASQLYKSNGVEFTAAEAWANAPKD